MKHGVEKDGRSSRLNAAARRLPWLVVFVTAVAWWPAVGTAVADPPSNAGDVPPAISGTLQQGDTLTVNNGTWSGDPTDYDYQWENCGDTGDPCSPIGTDASSYTLQASDVGDTIQAIVYATNSDGEGSATTASVGPVVPSPWVASEAPVITPARTPEQGDTLNVSTGTWGSDPTTTMYTYQWQDCSDQTCAPVASDGTSPSYTLQASDVGYTIEATVIATDSYGDVSEPSSSASVGPIASNATGTALMASPSSAVANQTVTLIATVSSGNGAPAPSGAMTFENGGTPIGGCANLPVDPTGESVTVYCPTSFAASTAGLTAVFVPDAALSLQGSTSPAEGVTITAAPAATPPTGTVTIVQVPVPAAGVVPVSSGVLGTITSTMGWTFYYTPSYTQIRALVVNGVPSGATVTVKCHGGGCPFAHHAIPPATMQRCGKKTTGMCAAHGSFDLTSGFANRRLAVGARITVVIANPTWIGKYYAFTVRARRGPRIRIACLAPGGTAPGQGC
jgi:hypothetical protein